MSNEPTALGGMLEQLAELGVIEFCSEPLDNGVERRLTAIWTTRNCPNCDTDALHALDGSARIWCRRCDWKTTYTRGTPSTTRNSPRVVCAMFERVAAKNGSDGMNRRGLQRCDVQRLRQSLRPSTPSIGSAERRSSEKVSISAAEICSSGSVNVSNTVHRARHILK